MKCFISAAVATALWAVLLAPHVHATDNFINYQAGGIGTTASTPSLQFKSSETDSIQIPWVHLDSALDLTGSTVTLNLTNVTGVPGATPSPSPRAALGVQGYTDGIPMPVSIPTLPTATRVSSTAYEASHVLKNGAAILISVSGYNSGPAQFIQLFNSTTVPADTAAPVAVFAVATTSNFSYTVPVTGVPFTTGIAVSNSSTGPTKTIGGSDCYFTAVVK